MLAATLLSLATAAWGGVALGAAAKAGPRKRPAIAAKAGPESTLADGDRALAAGDAAAAARAFAAAYRSAPTAALLLRLAQAADKAGQSVEARDYARRAMVDAVELSPTERTAAAAILAQPPPTAGELVVLGEHGLFVLVDDRLVGRLPLGAPLLLPPGSRRVQLDGGTAPMRSEVGITAGRRTEARFAVSTGAVMISQPPAAVILAGRIPEAARAMLRRAVAQGLEQRRVYALEPSPPGPAAPAEPTALPDMNAACESAACADLAIGAAQRFSANYAVVIEAELGDEVRIGLRLFDPAVREPASTRQERCPGCTIEQAAERVRLSVGALLDEGLGRPRARLAIRSEPPGAALEINGEPAGKTPYEATRWASSYSIALRLPGFREARRATMLSDGQPAELSVRLEPLPPPPVVALPPPILIAQPPERQPRPRWRLALGAVSLGAGLVAGGFGVGALTVNGSCIDAIEAPAMYCDRLYSTLPLGGALVGVGAALSVTGVVLLALPGPKTAAPTRPESQDRKFHAAR